MEGSVQIITFEAEFISQNAKELLTSSPLSGTDYHIVSIIGSQSTGKSTLLNLLFNTSFDVMDASRGRFQTTKGIHLAANRESKSLVIDIEGTDSQVRGDDGTAFEHMSALFALAVSDVLMVNMWTSEIGRYKAASVGLLKTIFEVNLKLFTQGGKKRILFVLRDFNTDSNNLSNIKQQISTTMEDLWSKIKKPASHSLLSVFDCFEFDFKTMAPKEFRTQEFNADVDDLRDRFTNNDRTDYLFRGKQTDIPLDGVPLYLSEIWTVVTSERDLNIPSQKQMLASLRCNELKLEAVQSFTEKVEPLRKNVGKLVMEDFAEVFGGHVSQSLLTYDEHGSEYEMDTYQNIRLELQSLLIDQMKDLFNQQMFCLVKESIAKFKTIFKQYLPSNAAVVGFNELLQSSVDEVKVYFDQIALKSIIEGSGWDSSSYETELMHAVDELSKLEIEKQENLLEKEVDKAMKGKFAIEINRVAERFYEGSMWENIRSQQSTFMSNLEKRVSDVLQGIQYDETRIESYIQDLRGKCRAVIFKKVKDFTIHLIDHLTKRFNTQFNKDERGVPREWKNVEIDDLFTKTKKPIVEYLELFRYFHVHEYWPEEPDEDHLEMLLEPHEFDLILENFTNNIDESYKNAMHIKEFGYAQTGIPNWMWALLLAVSWNEIYYVIQSPFVLYPLLLVLSVVALLFSMGMGSVPKFFLRQLLARFNIRF